MTGDTIAGAGERARLIADIAASPQARMVDEEDAALVRLSPEPLALFRFINRPRHPQPELPDAAGPAARIRGRVAAALVGGREAPPRYVEDEMPPADAKDDAEGQASSARFQPDADDVAQAVDAQPLRRWPLVLSGRAIACVAIALTLWLIL